MSGIQHSKDTNNIVTLRIDLKGAVNKIDDAFIEALEKSITQLEKEQAQLRGVIITSGKPTFIAGADLKRFLNITPEQASAFLAVIKHFKSLLRRLEKLPLPVVAAINGTAVGGGIEFSLACDHRIAINAPGIQLGLPEVTLGLLPGGGGLVRLIHTLGVEKAIPLVLSGSLLSPAEAKKVGLIDDLAETSDDLLKKATEWIQTHPLVQQPWDSAEHSIPGGHLQNPKIARWMAGMAASVIKKSIRNNPAVQEILNVATQALSTDFDTAQRIESRGLIKLILTQEAKNRINTLFFQLNEIKAGISRPRTIPRYTIKKVGILGAGMMGRGIALVCAKNGIAVILKDINYSTAHAGKDYCEKRLEKHPHHAKILNRIHPTDNPRDLQDCDLIIEAVFENIEIKRKVTEESEPYLSPQGIFASNTSTLPITILAKAANKAEHFIGIHFFSPVEKMQLIEIIVGKKTNKETLAKAFDFAQQIHKIPIVVNDSRGFFTSRVFGTYVDEGALLLEEGVNPAKIENAAKLAGFPIGPLAVTDEISQKLLIQAAKTNAQLDTDYGKANAMNGEASLRVANLLVEQFNRGGRAYNGGFYEYPEKGKKYLWPELSNHFTESKIKMSTKNIQDRLLFRQAIEAVQCYEEGTLNTVAEANIGSIFGIGFPSHTGGILQFINAYGLKKFVARSEKLAKKYGERFVPPEVLKKMIEENRLFI